MNTSMAAIAVVRVVPATNLIELSRNEMSAGEATERWDFQAKSSTASVLPLRDQSRGGLNGSRVFWNNPPFNPPLLVRHALEFSYHSMSFTDDNRLFPFRVALTRFR